MAAGIRAILFAAALCACGGASASATAPQAGGSPAALPATGTIDAAPADPADADAAPAVPSATREQCIQAVSHLNAFMPDQMSPDRSQDVKDCMQMPAPLVACLVKASTEARANHCVDEHLGRPSRADCQDSIAHIKTLDPNFGKGVDPSQVVDFCVTYKTRTELACIDDARTIEEARQCEQGP